MAIAFVGGATAKKAGATSGDSTLALNSGLTGGSRGNVEANDFVIAVYSVGGFSDLTLAITDGTTGYTLIGSELYADDTRDINLRVAYKFMGGTPDTATTFGPTTSTNVSGAVAVYVFSGVDQTTPIDVAAVTATGINTGQPNPGSITPSTSGAVVVAVGGGTDTVDNTFTSSDLSSFATNGGEGASTRKGTLGIGYIAWTSGAVDPAAFGGGSTATTESWGAVTCALRPASSGTTVTVAAVTVAYGGQALTVNAKRNVGVTAGSLSYAGQAITVNAKYFAAVVAATLAYAGQSVVSSGAVAAIIQQVRLALGLGLGL